MTTYSIGLKGVGAGQKFGVQAELVPDDVVATTGSTVTVATAGGLQYCARNGIPFLVQTNRGETVRMVYDPERSTPTVPVLRRV